jgi:isoquinoline 1-oxidoreductase beta subunit
MADLAHAPISRGPSRRTLLIGGGAGLGLLVAWAVWPRTYLPNLTVEAGETLFGAWLKIGSDGHVTVAVPQAELGQGVFTAFAQIIADELGADWKTVGVEPAPLNPLYANPLGASELFAVALGRLSQQMQRTHAARTALVLTAGSSSIRNFEGELRQAGAAARVMLCKAAARRWGAEWQSCGTVEGVIVHGNQRLRFGEVAAEAAGEDLPDPLPLRSAAGDAGAGRLYGQSAPRLDVPSKVDGSANYAADIRLPNMVHASVRQGPSGETALVRVDEAAANKVPGMLAVVTADQWVAAVADNWWAADRALGAMRPRFRVPTEVINSDSIEAALTKALDGDGERIASTGDLGAAFKGAKVVSAEYRVGLALHAALEPMTATASYDNGRLSLWMPSQAPGLARAAAARAAGLGEDSVTVHAMMAGGSFGAKLEFQVAEQAAVIAKRIGRPVQLTWNRGEDFRHDRFRPAAAARMTGRLGEKGGIAGWLAKIAAPETSRALAARLMGGDSLVTASLALPGAGDPSAVAGAIPPYGIANLAIDHHSADIGLVTGHWRSGAHSYTAFFTESFIDELAHVANVEAVSFRMAMLGNAPRLARCLQTAAQLGGWQGGVAGSGQGIACHAFNGSYIAVMAEAHLVGRKVKVDRLVAAVDVGRVVNPALLQQQIEGGLIFGMAAATGCSTGFTDNIADVKSIAELGLPTLADSPDITVEIIRSESDPGGVGELAVPPVAPAIANALQAASGVRFRRLPLLSDVE